MNNKNISLFIIATISLNCFLSSIREKYWDDTVFIYYYRSLRNEELYNRYRIKNDDNLSNKYGILTLTKRKLKKNLKNESDIYNFAVRYFVKKTVVEENFNGSIILNTFKYENKSLENSTDILIVFTKSDPEILLNNLKLNNANHLANNRTPLVLNKNYLDNLNLDDINNCLESIKLKTKSEYKDSQQDQVQDGKPLFLDLKVYENQSSCIPNS
ncbi:Hypothetical protein LBF_2118 [Leptospira biflexa serovar Patoc strain 'Patoc 1 (Ames)']|uniref:Uncharacterized protein n=1 Tax=Leptospira biflexa serovar Patoc (strain Patoc 1 / ATCC 23582 / Paris) TaxID=456481 RepID=B0ST38_LEPBP|nr:hypothetical protein [Leptospira biflexa]ABZ94615.1 Hypothetical protein LBF_2118 [Leptospira biflexa serovar Patoc strain 'Patoc 1 (Ames)']ABZ98278.1 Hypothetical protein LEPBI_I2179 [Leptospira biflexa serovar Patoc strain 'Patoc 1 (Paris)']